MQEARNPLDHSLVLGLALLLCCSFAIIAIIALLVGIFGWGGEGRSRDAK